MKNEKNGFHEEAIKFYLGKTLVFGLIAYETSNTRNKKVERMDRKRIQKQHHHLYTFLYRNDKPRQYDKKKANHSVSKNEKGLKNTIVILQRKFNNHILYETRKTLYD